MFEPRLDPAYLRRNVQTLRKIGGVYDYIAAHVEQTHKELIMGLLPFKALEPGATLPTRGYADDAGLDLYVLWDTVISAGYPTDVRTGVAVELPDGYWGMLVGRSSALRVKGLLVNTGIIDTGYRGELFINCVTIGDEDVFLAKGERLAQLILLPVVGGDPVFVEELAESERGTNGFGSTGS